MLKPSSAAITAATLGVALLFGCGRITHSSNARPAGRGDTAGGPLSPHDVFSPDSVQVGPPKHVDTGRAIDTTVVYSLSDGRDHAELTWHDDGDRKIHPPLDLSFESWRGERPVATLDRALPLNRRMEFLRTTMTRMLRQTPPQTTYGFMMLGYPELFDRMPELLADSKCWNRRAGYGVPDSSTCVREALNAGNAYRELSATMRQLGYGITIDSGPEEVLAMPVSQLFPEQRKLLDASVKSTDNFPRQVGAVMILRSLPQ